MNLLKAGSDWLEAQRTESLAEDVTYLRGDAAVSLRATIGRSQFDQTGSDGLVTRVEARDYLLLAAELAVDGVPFEPEPGHRIVEGDPDTGECYEVMDLPGEPCWRWSDQFRVTYRIHTKHIGSMPIGDEEEE